MIKSRTVFIVGAGASQEVGLPTGREFKREISEKLNIRFDGFTMTSGDHRIENVIREYLRTLHPHDGNINEYLHAAWKICNALPQALSIDNVLDAHTGDEKIQMCGKLGIVRTILEAERASNLYLKPREKANYQVLESTWYAQFLKLVTENVRKEDIEDLFEQVSFITFNYDRCIEQYLTHALSNYYAISQGESERLVSKLVVKHIYGQVGSLPFQHKINNVEFGATQNVDLVSVVSQIKTFTQQEADPTNLREMRQLIHEAETIVFLGFAFHELNMQLLDPQIPTDVKRVFATAKGISDDDCLIVKEDIRSILHEYTAVPIFLNNKLTCYELFETHWRSLSR